VPPVRELAPAANIKEALLKDFLHRKSRTGELVRVTPDRFYPKATLAQLAAIAQELSAAVPNGLFSAGQYRDRTGLGRSLAIEILECLDRLGITQRIGDARKLRRDFAPLLGAATAPPPHAASAAKAPPTKPAVAPRPAPRQFKR
jgi:selenocysteine-specific elongation factor